MLRRRFLKVLSLLSFGLLFTDKARGSASTLPPIDDVRIQIRYQGKTYALAHTLSDDPAYNSKLYHYLVQSVEDSLWALYLTETPEHYRHFMGDPRRGGWSDSSLQRKREDIRKRMGLIQPPSS